MEKTIRFEMRVPVEDHARMTAYAVRHNLYSTTGRKTGDPAIGAAVLRIFAEEAKQYEKAPTLLARSKEDPKGTRDLMLCALKLSDGNAESARAALAYTLHRDEPVSEGDWRRTVEALKMGEEIRRRWPAKTAKKGET